MNSHRCGPHTACGLANVTALLCLVTGCSQSVTLATDSSPQNRVELTLVDRAQFDAVLAHHKGNVILVDCWASWCGPCVAQLPHSIELAKQYGPAGFEVVTLNFDDPDAAETVVGTLEKSGAPEIHLTNLQSRFGGSTESMDAFEITSGALPHYKLFDRAGQLRHTFELDPAAAEQFTPADIDAAVTKLLAEQ
jgi:thiol-disulfide isomerase/thioredoxin